MSPAFSIYLDALRLSAALVVFAHHASYARFDGGWISRLGGFGHEAVVVFFVLSGLVIAYVVDMKERTPGQYAASRLSRLWSVALPAIVVTLALDSAGRLLAPEVYADVQSRPLGALTSLVFANEWWFLNLYVGSNVPYWSLSYEAAYYVLFGVFAFVGARAIWLVVAAAAIGPKILLLFPAWLVGVAVYRSAQVTRSTRRNVLLAALGAALALAVALTKVGNLYITWRWQDWLGTRAFDAMGNAASFASDNVIAIGLGLHFVGVAGICRGINTPAYLRHSVSKAALATFPIYLLHYPALYFFSAVSVYAFHARIGPAIGIASLGVGLLLTPISERFRWWLRKIMSRWLRALDTGLLGRNRT